MLTVKHDSACCVQTVVEVVEIKMKQPCLRLYPEHRLVPQYDESCIRKLYAASRSKMGWRVLDDFAEEHIQ